MRGQRHVKWTVFGYFQLTGKEAYDAAIESPGRDSGEVMRMSMAEVFVMRGGKIAERRAWVIELKENDHR